MNPMGLTPNEFTTARLNGHPLPVRQCHRRWTAADYVPGSAESDEYEPVAVTVVAPVRLSLEDVTAALFDWMAGGVTAEELADDSTVRLLVAETVINGGGGQIEELRCRLGEQTELTADQAAYLAYCRERAAAVFTARPTERPRPRELARAR